MPIQIEQIPGEHILAATVNEPFDPENDVSSMFAQFIRIRQTINGPIALARLCTFKRQNTTSRQARRTTDERLLSYRGFPPMFEKSAGKTKAGDGPWLMHRKK
jgi:hypothetical protein